MKNLIQSVLILIAMLKSVTGTKLVKYTQLGKTVTLSPPVSQTPRYLYWYFGDLEIAWLNNLGGHGLNKDEAHKEEMKKWDGVLSLSRDSLIIQNIKQEHFGIFTCKVMERNGQRSTIITYELLRVDVSVRPTSPVVPGESLYLDCKGASTQDRKEPEIHWLNPQGKKVTSNKGVLTEKVTGQHHGLWTCVTTLDKQENKVTVSVQVLDLTPAHPRKYTSTFTPLMIPCSVPPTFTWKQFKDKGLEEGNWYFYPESGSSLIHPQKLFSLQKDGLTWSAEQNRDLIPGKFENGDLSLSRTRGREEDRGNYVFTLKFRNGVTLNRTVHVDVLQITSSPGTDLISGQPVNLSCSLAHPLPSDLLLKWLPPKLSLTSVHPSTHLTIPEVGVKDGGRWKCELWQNKTLLTWATTDLKIETTMSVWMLVIICSVAVIVPLLILVFVLFQCRQRKRRQFRHRLCQCKNPKPKGFYRT